MTTARRRRLAPIVMVALLAACSSSTSTASTAAPEASTPQAQAPPTSSVPGCRSSDARATLLAFVQLGSDDPRLATTCYDPAVVRPSSAWLTNTDLDALLLDEARQVPEPPAMSMPDLGEDTKVVTYQIPFPDVPRCDDTLSCAAPHQQSIDVALAQGDDGLFGVAGVLFITSS